MIGCWHTTPKGWQRAASKGGKRFVDPSRTTRFQLATTPNRAATLRAWRQLALQRRPRGEDDGSIPRRSSRSLAHHQDLVGAAYTYPALACAAFCCRRGLTHFAWRTLLPESELTTIIVSTHHHRDCILLPICSAPQSNTSAQARCRIELDSRLEVACLACLLPAACRPARLISLEKPASSLDPRCLSALRFLILFPSSPSLPSQFSNKDGIPTTSPHRLAS